METMKRRTKAAKMKKMAGTQKARDMMMAFVVVGSDAEEGEEGKSRGNAKTCQGCLLSWLLKVEREWGQIT